MDPILWWVACVAFLAGGAAVGACLLMVERRDYEAGRSAGYREGRRFERERQAERQAWGIRVR